MVMPLYKISHHMQEQLKTMPIQLPQSRVTDTEMLHSFWAPITNKKHCEELIHITLKNKDNMKNWDMEIPKRAAWQKQEDQ